MAAIAAGLLRSVKGVIGAANQARNVVIAHELGYAQAAGNFEYFAVAIGGSLRDGSANPLGDHAGRGSIGGGQNHAEFLAAVAAG